MKPELVESTEWNELTEQIDDEFGDGISKALLGDRAPVTITHGDTKSFYLIPIEWMTDIEDIEKEFEIHSLGIRLGDATKEGFRLSLQILEALAEVTDRKLIVSRQGAEAFSYGRSILKESVIKLNPSVRRGQMVIVLNKDGEVLGLAALSVDGNKLRRLARNRLVAKNILDIGTYLRGA
ncbi:MAG: PUA domain-containing protein [Candidatus Thorarchaeota archaeon]